MKEASSQLPATAVFSARTATIQNSPPLLTSNKSAGGATSRICPSMRRPAKLVATKR